jgi:hypothetical protein
MAKLMIGKTMFKPTTTNVIMEKIIITELIMVKPANVF